ncbi:MAG: flagellar hook-basal body complex protein, partial [Candidatus Marinimicrobia bacterium]|nr:flagellar hook-basal body complex protein [Candidatus Neomarinimicrobiota bacterium]
MAYEQALGTGDTFTSVLSSLKNQRKRIDVIGTNISNINTIGFKSSRMTFLEMMGQTVGKLYTPFDQGSFTATGSVTDMAVDGDSFFVLKNASGDYVYSRAGAFYFDEAGQLVNQNREVVQGWLNDDIIAEESTTTYGASDLNAVGAINGIQLDPEMRVGAIATENIWLGGNINAGLEAVKNILRSTDTLRYENSNGVPVYADETTLMNDLVHVDQDNPLVAGDVINITGTDKEGNEISEVFTFTADATVGDFITSINAAFAGSTATLEDGKIVLTDDNGGDSLSTIKLTAAESNTGTISLSSSFTNVQEGMTPTATASIIVYDSFGSAHHLSLEFMKTGEEREWAWTASVDGEEAISAGNTGIITFDTAGNFISNTYDDNSGSLVITTANGSEDITLQMHAAGGEGLTPLSQYDSVTTMSVRQQDGQASGSLEGLTIDEDGY